MSNISTIFFPVPVLGPFLFSLFILPLMLFAPNKCLIQFPFLMINIIFFKLKFYQRIPVKKIIFDYWFKAITSNYFGDYAKINLKLRPISALSSYLSLFLVIFFCHLLPISVQSSFLYYDQYYIF